MRAHMLRQCRNLSLCFFTKASHVHQTSSLYTIRHKAPVSYIKHVSCKDANTGILQDRAFNNLFAVTFCLQDTCNCKQARQNEGGQCPSRRLNMRSNNSLFSPQTCRLISEVKTARLSSSSSTSAPAAGKACSTPST